MTRAHRASGVRIGIDIGGTKSHAVTVEPDGTVSGEVLLATRTGEAGVLAGIAATVERLSTDRGIAVDDLESLGIGIPGLVDARLGRVRQAINLEVADWSLADAVSDAVGIRPLVDNDVNAAALGAQSVLGIAGSLAYLNLGTGVAAGIVLDGRLRRGAGIAGEIGHIPIDPDGPLCDCGQRGCIEAFAGGRALARRAPRGDQPLRAVLDAADAGDRTAAALRAAFGWSVAAAVQILVLTVDVRHIVIGGGALALGDRLREPVVEALERLHRESALVASLGLVERVAFLAPGHRAPAIGAALLEEENS